MEKRKLSGKTILKLTGALLALGYFGFCLYAGITGKFPGMHRKQHVMRFGDLKNWVSGGMSAVMIAVFCINSAINDLKLQKKRKKSSTPFFFIMLLLLSLPLLLESYLDIGWIGIALYAGIAAFLFGIAWIPQILNQWISRRLLREKPMSGKQQVRIIEWIHFYPLKKLLILAIWGFGVVLVLRGIWVTATGKLEMDGDLFLFLLVVAVLVVALFQKMRRYICTSYPNLSVLNQILSRKQLEQLLEGEHFEPIVFEDAAMKQYLEIYRSQNWMLIGGKLLSKKLALWVTMNRSRNDTSLNVLYLNGMTAKAKVNLELRENRYEEFIPVLRELIGHEESLKLYGKEEQMAEKFASYFLNCNSEQERIAFFLTRDITEIRKDYIQTFSPPDTRKKKRSRQERK
ncbi:hypothetical protein [Blautia wexlerae]|uniref:hypothetical protein n=1 Tax=Blautia wexlerae TaxID=418240 RepID=UPI0004160A77|nr:hypothetical protein [Blautia wexlerae]